MEVTGISKLASSVSTPSLVVGKVPAGRAAADTLSEAGPLALETLQAQLASLPEVNHDKIAAVRAALAAQAPSAATAADTEQLARSMLAWHRGGER